MLRKKTAKAAYRIGEVIEGQPTFLRVSMADGQVHYFEGVMEYWVNENGRTLTIRHLLGTTRLNALDVQMTEACHVERVEIGAKLRPELYRGY